MMYTEPFPEEPTSYFSMLSPWKKKNTRSISDEDRNNKVRLLGIGCILFYELLLNANMTSVMLTDIAHPLLKNYAEVCACALLKKGDNFATPSQIRLCLIIMRMLVENAEVCKQMHTLIFDEIDVYKEDALKKKFCIKKVYIHYVLDVIYQFMMLQIKWQKHETILYRYWIKLS